MKAGGSAVAGPIRPAGLFFIVFIIIRWFRSQGGMYRLNSYSLSNGKVYTIQTAAAGMHVHAYRFLNPLNKVQTCW